MDGKRNHRWRYLVFSCIGLLLVVALGACRVRQNCSVALPHPTPSAAPAPVMPEVKLFPVRPKVPAAQYRHADAPLHFTANSTRYPAINAVFPHSRVVRVRTDKLAPAYDSDLDQDYISDWKLSPDGKRIALTMSHAGEVVILTVADGAVESVGDKATRRHLETVAEPFWDPHRPQALLLDGSLDRDETKYKTWYKDLATGEIKLFMEGATASIEAVFPNDTMIYSIEYGKENEYHNVPRIYFQVPLDLSQPSHKINPQKIFGSFYPSPNMLYSVKKGTDWSIISFYNVRKKALVNISIKKSLKRFHHSKMIHHGSLRFRPHYSWLPDTSGIFTEVDTQIGDQWYTDLVKVLRNGKVTVYGPRVTVLANSYNGKHWLVKAGKNYYVVSVR